MSELDLPSWLGADDVTHILWIVSKRLNLYSRAIDFLKKKPTVLVLGSTGVGKTNLLRSLSSPPGLVDPISRFTRTETPAGETVRIDGHPFRVIDTPGQMNHESARLKVIREAMANPPVRVINVVCYGYHEYQGQADQAVKRGVPSEKFLREHRRREIEAAQNWIPLLGDTGVTEWVATVVTKADLWWPEHDSVREHYANGEYADAIMSVDPRIRHAVLSYCSVFHKFFDEVRLPGEFDDARRIETNVHFLNQLVNLG